MKVKLVTWVVKGKWEEGCSQKSHSACSSNYLSRGSLFFIPPFQLCPCVFILPRVATLFGERKWKREREGIIKFSFKHAMRTKRFRNKEEDEWKWGRESTRKEGERERWLSLAVCVLLSLLLAPMQLEHYSTLRPGVNVKVRESLKFNSKVAFDNWKEETDGWIYPFHEWIWIWRKWGGV